MTIKMRLDTEGLRALIASNPELELEIGREVVKNVTDEAIRSNITRKIETVLKSMVKNEGTGWQPIYKPVGKEFIAAVNSSITEAVRELIDATVTRAVDDAVLRQQVRIATEVKSLLRELITPDMARDIVREKILL